MGMLSAPKEAQTVEVRTGGRAGSSMRPAGKAASGGNPSGFFRLCPSRLRQLSGLGKEEGGWRGRARAEQRGCNVALSGKSSCGRSFSCAGLRTEGNSPLASTLEDPLPGPRWSRTQAQPAVRVPPRLPRFPRCISAGSKRGRGRARDATESGFPSLLLLPRQQPPARCPPSFCKVERRAYLPCSFVLQGAPGWSPRRCISAQVRQELCKPHPNGPSIPPTPTHNRAADTVLQMGLSSRSN